MPFYLLVKWIFEYVAMACMGVVAVLILIVFLVHKHLKRYK